MALATRMARELKKLEKQPPPGIAAWPVTNSINKLQVQLQGPPDTPYELGLFKLIVSVPDRYPYQPPNVQFNTPVYHPNVDAAGRICLDYLNMPPKGSWSPAMDLYKVLVAIRQLLAEPNPKDPLMVEIAEELVSHPEVFRAKARQHVAKHATPGGSSSSDGSSSRSGCSSRSTTQGSGHCNAGLGALARPAADAAAAAAAAAADSTDAGEGIRPSPQPKQCHQLQHSNHAAGGSNSCDEIVDPEEQEGGGW